MKDHYYSEERATRVIDFIENFCTHVEGPLAGKPLILEKWQKEDIIKPIFGWIDGEGNRVVREAYIEVPKKNGKSALLSALGLYMLVADREPAPRVICAASSIEQVRQIHDVSKAMVSQNVHLSGRLKSQHNSILKKTKIGSFKVISSDADRSHGINASCVLVDELHAHKTRELYDAIKTACTSRAQGLVLTITTAGYDRTSICWNRHEYARKVIAGKIKDPRFHGVIYSADVDDDPFKESTWKKANPNYGVSFNKITMEGLANEAKEDPAALNNYKRLHLNIWTTSHTPWILPEVYNKCNKGGDPKELLGKKCWVGMDLGDTDDLTAIVCLFHEGGEFQVVPYFFCTSRKLNKVNNNTLDVTYSTWHKEGLIHVAGDEGADYEIIKDHIHEIIKKYQVQSIGYDGWNASMLANELKKLYEPKIPINVFSMGVKEMNWPSKKLELDVKNEEVNHFGHPILSWMIDNCMVMKDANDNIKLNKAKASGKIDGVVAWAMAIGEYTDDPNKDRVRVTKFSTF